MVRQVKNPSSPTWDKLYELAASKEGHFTTAEAAEAGYSSPLLHHYIRLGRVIRIRRGVYRLVHFPAGEHEDLVAVWLWSEMMGVFSHETALSLHDLSDVLPSTVHITLPASWQKRRFRIPRGVFLHFTDVTKADRAWVGSVPVTSPRRTLYDCVEAHTSPETIEKAVQDAVNRGLVTKSEADEITAVQRKEKKSG